MIDSHLHVVDFLQRPISPGELGSALATAERAVVFGLPVKKKWAVSEPERPTYYLDDNAPCGAASITDELTATVVAGLPADQQARVAPLICGFDPTDLLAPEHVELMTARHDGWRGVGEVLLRHDDLTELTYGENARAGHPALDEVLGLCAGRDWAFLFHQDASSAGRPGGHEYVGEVRRMLTRHPQVPQVWAHAGVSRRVHPNGLVRLLAELLEDHAHLHIDLSWEVYDSVVLDGEVDDDWLRLVETRPDRFVLGSDVFGTVEPHQAQLGRWSALTDRLTGVARDLVERGNAERLWWS